jgi:sec-independent protein translocase protein TatA
MFGMIEFPRTVASNLLGWQDILVVLVIGLFLFGGKKIPEMAKGLGEGIRSFKDALKDDNNEKKPQ